MTFMRAAIAAKPDEQFPGSQQDDRMPKAPAALPANSKPLQPGPVSLPRPLKPGATTKPASRPQPVLPGAISPAISPAFSPAQPARKPAIKLAADVPAAGRQVRPALPPQPAPAMPRAKVKPALNNPQP
jgi:hypothetical protein